MTSHKKYIIISALTIMSVAVLFVYMASTPYGENIVRETLEKKLSESLGMKIEIASFETNIVSRIQFSGLHVSHPIDNEEHSFITSGDILVSFRLWHLLRTAPSIESIAVDSLKVDIVRDSTGFRIPLNPKEKKSSNSTGLNQVVHIGRVVVLNSSLTFDDISMPLHLLTQNASVKIEEKDAGIYSYHIGMESWDVEYKHNDIPVNSLLATGLISSEMVSIEKFNLNIGEMDVDIESMVRFDDPPVRFDGRLHISGDLNSLKPVFNDLVPPDIVLAQGSIDTEILFSGTPADPELSFSFITNDIMIKNVECRSIVFNGSMMDRLLKLEQIEISALNGNLAGKGQLHADSLLTHELELEIQGIDLPSAWDVLKTGTSPYTGHIDGSLESYGPLRSLFDCTADADITLKEISFRTKKIEDFNCNVLFDNKRLRVEARQPQTDLTTNVLFGEETVSGNFVFKTANPGFLARFANVFNLKGMLNIQGDISGNTANPFINMDFLGKDILYHGFPIEMIQGRLMYKDGDVIIEESSFSGSLASIDSLADPFRVPDFHGSAKYSGSLKGNLHDLDGFVDLNLIKPEYKGFSFEDIKATISIKENLIDINHATCAKDSFFAILNGRYDITSKHGAVSLVFESDSDSSHSTTGPVKSAVVPANNKSQGKMTLEWNVDENGEMDIVSSGVNLSISDIARIKAEPVSVSGLADYDITFKGSLARPNMTLSAEISSPMFKNTSFESINGTVHIEPDRLILENMDILVNGQKTETRGEIALKQSGTAIPVFDSESEFDFTSQGYNVSVQLLKQFLPANVKVNGNSKYDLDFKGTLSEPKIKGNIAFMDTEIQLNPDLTPILLNIQASLDDSTLVIRNTSGSIGEIPFAISGDVVSSDWEVFRADLDISVLGKDVFKGSGMFNKHSIQCRANVTDFDVKLLQEFLPGVNSLGGIADSQLNIAGPYSDPHVNGSLAIRDIEFKSPLFSEAVNSGMIFLRFDQKSISIDSLSTYWGKGWISAKGTMSYENKTISNVDLTATADKLEFNSPKEYGINVDTARLRCTKQNAYYTLEGEIMLGESKYIKNIDVKNLLSFAQKVERPSPDPSPFATQMRMNILIRNNKNVWVDNNLAHFRIRSDLGLIGTLARPNMTGRITVEEGYLIYLDKKFRIVNGVMEFIDPNRLNPLINLTTTTTLKAYQSLSGVPYVITLEVSGPLDETVLALTSEPPLDKPDIMGLLTIGATRTQLAGQQTDEGRASFNDILKERAAVLSSQKLSGFVTERAGSILGLEEISIEGNLFNTGKSSGPQLVTSEKINDRMGITYSTAVGHLNDQRIMLDYKLNNHFSLVGETDQRGRSALDLKYKLRFK